MADNSTVQFNKMINTPVSRLITGLAVPTIMSMLVTSIYNMADTYFVSQISTETSAAVGIVFPIMTIIQAFGFAIGMGSASLISRLLGQKENEKARKISATGFYTAIFTGLLIFTAGSIFSSQVMKMGGASENVLPYAKAYARYIFFGAPIMCASFVMNNILRSEGKSFFAMLSLVSGGILNIFLDPIFIFKLNLGISGAAIATLISQCVSFSLLASWFIRGKAICSLNVKYFSAKFRSILKIFANGAPSLARQGLASIATILLNRACVVYGDHAVAAMTIVTKIVMFVASIMIGIGQGFTPVSGYNYGAKRYDRVKKAYWFTVFSGMFVLGIFATVVFIFAPEILRLFRKDDLEVIKIGTVALRWQIAVIPLHPIIVTTNMLLQSTGKIPQATFLSCNRQGVYFIPFILILPFFMGLFGVEIAQAAADFLSILTAIPFLIWFNVNNPEKVPPES